MKTIINNNKTSNNSLLFEWRKTGLQKLMLFTLIAVMVMGSFSSCEKSGFEPNTTNTYAQANSDNTNSGSKLGQTQNAFKKITATEILNESIANWNLHFGTSAQALGFMHVGKIADETNRQSIISAITDPSTYAPFGDPTNPASVGVQQLNKFNYDPAKFESIIDSLISVGHDLYMINWKLQGSNTPFSTLCIFSGNEFVYDNIIANVMLVDNSGKKPVAGGKSGHCDDKKWHDELVVNWLFFGTERGRAEVTVKLPCDWTSSLTAPGTGFYYDCFAGESEFFTYGHYTLGTHNVDAAFVTPKDKKRCAKIRGVLSLSALTASVKATFNVVSQQFEIEVSGIGTTTTKRFEKALCCGK